METRSNDLISLWQALDPVVGSHRPAAWSGPRWWWAGALDVEGPALGSMTALITALGALERARGATRGYAVDAGAVAASFASFGHLRIDGQARAGFAPSSGFFPAAGGWVAHPRQLPPS